MRAKAKIERELCALPQVDLADVERELRALAKLWQMANTGGYGMPHAMSWERKSVASGTWRPDMPRKLTGEQAQLLRETLLKLNCRISIHNRVVFISGRLPLGVRARTSAS